MIRAAPQVAEMAPYALADLAAPKGKRLTSLSQNESVRKPSPYVSDAIASAAMHPQLYPDPNWTELREVIAEVHDLDPNLIVCGNGSLDLIAALAHAYLNVAGAAMVPAHAYPFFRTATQMTAARIDAVAETDLYVDVDAMLAAARADTRIVFLANPGNPTGTRLPRSEVLRLRAGLRDDVILVLDEAYGEFADHLKEPMFDLVELGNTLVLRTFSKAYGLAGLRIGWGYVPPKILAEMRKVMNPNNVALPGQLAAIAAMKDQDYMRETCAITTRIRDLFATRLKELRLDVPVSHTNFVLMRFATLAQCSAVDAALNSEGIFLRPQGGAGLPDCLRATVGQEQDMDMAARVIELAISKECSA